MKHWKAIAAAAVLLIGIVIFATKTGPAPATAEVAQDTPYMQEGAIRFSPRFAERAGITYDKAAPRELAPVVEVTGSASFDPFRLAVAGARIDGRVHAVYKKEGDIVSQGEVLAELESADVGRAQAEVLKLRAKEVAVTAEETRANTLAEARVISTQEAELAKAAAIAVRAERSAAEGAVRALGGEPGDKDIGVLKIRAPIAGKVIDIGVHRGQVVDAKTNVATIADLSRLWITLSVFEQDILAIRQGDKVELRPQASSDLVTGTVDHVGDVIEEETRSANVRVVIDNKNNLLRPGLALRGRIFASGPKASWLSVPNEAIIRVDGKPTLFVARADGVVDVRTVKLGAQTRTHTAVLSGLEPDERVVTGGVFALKSEIFR